jgi:hypothetical protein
MSNLQLALIVAGIVAIVLVVIYNAVVERRARTRAERAFGEQPPDALFGEEPARREPTMGALPEANEGAGREAREAGEAGEAELAGPLTRPRSAADELQAGAGPDAGISTRIDTVAVILADEPVMAEQVEEFERVLRFRGVPVRIEGIVDEQWQPVAESTRGSWRELRAGMQLADREGARTEEEVEAFNAAIAEFAAGVNAVSQREAPSAAAARARELDQFAAAVDIEVAVNVVGQFGATFALPRVKQLALERGLAESASGELARYGADGAPEYVIRRFDEKGAKPAAYLTGITFALDVPHAAQAPEAFDEMALLAEDFARSLGGQLVDDNRRALTEQGIASIRRSVEQVVHDMEAHGIPAGSALAHRLFS